MATKVQINGFGRIGRLVFNASLLSDAVEVVSVNDLFPAATLAHLLKYDSIHGKSSADIRVEGDNLVVDGKKIAVTAIKDPGQLPHKEQGVDIVIESTGVFRKRDQVKAHLDAGAKKVIITAPATEPDITVVMGVNDQSYDPASHHILSNASCTTNCLAPVTKVVLERFGVKRGLMTTIHSYTNDQRIIDFAHKDLRRARAAALNMIPTTTGAARAIGLVIPELKGKLDGLAIRVPTPNVSLVDVVYETEKPATKEDLLAAFKQAAEGELKGILALCEEPLVSGDFNHSDISAIVDAECINVVGDTLVKVMAWYDNEWAYSVRCIDLAALVAKSL
ncbi:glyceraldehyde-3-phosphate dehydrogenase [candidate division BRC1 bacterium SM23_51]|nr:MAG: glyceraldehyde-3-phosphate dehydrogenase [candidate division BRC1 bacterium SM23_51]